METELGKENIREVTATADRKSGKLTITLVLDPDKLSETDMRYVKKLSKKKPSKMLKGLGDKSVEGILALIKD